MGTMKVRLLLRLLLLLLPWRLRRPLLNLLCGYKIHPRARIGFTLILADRLEMDEGATIGHLTFCGPIARLKMGPDSLIGRLNHISGYPEGGRIFFTAEPCRHPELILESNAHITDRHIIDCSNTVTMGKFSVFAGHHSHILTHSIDLETCRQTSHPVWIGSYCFVGSRCMLLAGSCLPDHSILGAGSVLNRAYKEPYQLYAGNPAQVCKPLPETMKFFARKTGFVS